MSSDWMNKVELFLKQKSFTCPQGNTLGGLIPVNYIEQKERPGTVVKCRCEHCGVIVTIDWKFIKDYLEDLKKVDEK